VPQVIAQELPEALPRLVEIPLGTWAALFFAILLIAALVRIIVDPPPQIGEETARKLRWPMALLIGFVLVGIGMLAVPRNLLEELPPGLISAVTMVLMPVLLAPAMALLWRLLLEVVADGVWSFVSSIRALAECWLPIAALILIANLLRPMGVLAGGGYVSVWGGAYLVVLVALTLAPWTVLDRGAALWPALTRSWALFRQKPVDVIAFGLRFALMFAVLGGLVALVQPNPAVEWTGWVAPLLTVIRNLLLLLQAMVLARFYVHLAELFAADEECATCPATRMAEDLAEQAEEGTE
jgi:hypothetical protein